MDLTDATAMGRDNGLYALKEAGKRMADVLNLALIAQGPGISGRWMAFQLADGRGDATIYDTRADAIRHQFHETLCHYEKLRPSGWSPDECAMTLAYCRAAYDAGWRPSAEDPAPIMPVRSEDFTAKYGQLKAAHRR